MPLQVSVALCTRNGARFVEEQVRSILAQTVAPMEIIVSDDASSDGTVAAIRRLVDLHPSGTGLLVIENQIPLGVTANFEQAVRACRGDLVALSDQDDIWEADRLEKILGIFEHDQRLDLLGGDATLIDGAGAKLPLSLFETLEISSSEIEALRGESAFEALIHRNLVTGATIVFRRHLLAVALPFPDSWVHDEWLTIIAAATGRMAVTTDRLVRYRQHGANEIGARRRNFMGKVRRALEPREHRNRVLAARANSLVERLDAMPGRTAEQWRALARHKRDYELWRMSLPTARPLRIAPILAAVLRRDYSRYGRGVPDAVRDLVQPAV